MKHLDIKAEFEETTKRYIGAAAFESVTILGGRGYTARVKTRAAAEKLNRVWAKVPGQKVTFEATENSFTVIALFDK